MNDARSLTAVVLEAAHRVHSALGPGLTPEVYSEALVLELTTRGLRWQRKVAIPVVYQGTRLKAGFHADLILEDTVLVQIDTSEGPSPHHHSRLAHQLRWSGLTTAILIPFDRSTFDHGACLILHRADADGAPAPSPARALEPHNSSRAVPDPDPASDAAPTQASPRSPQSRPRPVTQKGAERLQQPRSHL